MAGSRAYGTNHEDSDTDIRGIFIAPPEYFASVFKRINQAEDTGSDTIYYELGRFAKLASEMNPSIIELLFTDHTNILYCNSEFHTLRSNRHLFLSTRAKHRFCGYAFSQLKRIMGHNKWINNPMPKKPPSLRQYCNIVCASNGVVSKPTAIEWKNLNKHAFLLKASGEQCYRLYGCRSGEEGRIESEDGKNLCVRDTIFKPSQFVQFLGILICDIKKFKEAIKRHKEYWEWKKNRNPARAALEEKFGFDTKHAMHLVRLMTMVRKILSGQGVIVRRPDAKELLEILNGKMNYEELITWGKATEAELDELYEKSPLPKCPDIGLIDNLVMKIRKDHWEKKGLI
jgi:predicted nucleotidyltransferase